MLEGESRIFFLEYVKFFFLFLRKFLVVNLKFKFEEYIRLINGIEMRLEFFIFLKIEKVLKKYKKIKYFID